MRFFSFKFFLFCFSLFLIFPRLSFADVYLQKQIFFVEKKFDIFQRDKILATNLVLSEKLYIYVEDDFWFPLSSFEKEKIFENLKNLAKEFDFKIYPKLTSILGTELPIGKNGDSKITILLHRMREDIGGYSREADYYERILAPTSNERKLLYLSTGNLETNSLKETLIHEFSHMILFYQKTQLRKVSEERWVQEIVAEISPTILGEEKSLKSRIELFRKYPKDSILEWQEKIQDYGALSIFAHYLLDQFGENVFTKIVQSSETGYLAIEKATGKTLEEIFENFLIAVYLNDCNFKREYCFKIPELQNFRIVPDFHFLPLDGEATLTLYRSTKDFAGDWQKIYGGKGNLEIGFNVDNPENFSISALLCKDNVFCELQKLNLKEAPSILKVSNFDKNYSSLTLFIFSKKEKKEIEGTAPSYDFSLSISFRKALPSPLPISSSTSTISTTTPTSTPPFSCSQITKNLRFGMRDPQVACLQEVLKMEGPSIYPQGLVTGYFGPLTFFAVRRFQQKYWQEILAPWGLKKEQATGFVGPRTRAKLNEILASKREIK